MGNNIKVVAQIAATYIGTVVGAGFATGQEILQFFTLHSWWGILGIMLSTFLFIWLGSKMMLLSHRIEAYSYQELNYFLFGKALGTVVNLFVLCVLFGVTSVMLSGTGAIFEEQLGLPYSLGILITLVLCFVVMMKGLNGIFLVNSLVVPMMLLFSMIIIIQAVGGSNHSALEGFFQFYTWRESWEGWKWLFHACTYVAFNLCMAQAVLVPLGQEVKDTNLLKWGGIWGGIGLGFMLLASHLALQTVLTDVLQLDIPMAVVIKNIGQLVLILFLVVIYGEVFTTLIGNVFGITRQIRSSFNLPEWWIHLFILLSSFIISQVGFSSLVAYLYPLFGYLGLALLLYLGLKKIPA